jgi:hypothetical protein
MASNDPSLGDSLPEQFARAGRGSAAQNARQRSLLEELKLEQFLSLREPEFAYRKQRMPGCSAGRFIHVAPSEFVNCSEIRSRASKTSVGNLLNRKASEIELLPLCWHQCGPFTGKKQEVAQPSGSTAGRVLGRSPDVRGMRLGLPLAKRILG